MRLGTLIALPLATAAIFCLFGYWRTSFAILLLAAAISCLLAAHEEWFSSTPRPESGAPERPLANGGT